MSPKPFVFVVMPFSPKFQDTYLLGIKPACEEAGCYCERLDEQIFAETMLERIYNQISKADLIVADLTDRNPNVFYETGYAHALGKRVILLTRNADDIPFDLKHYTHIVYSSGIAPLKQQIRERVAHFLSNPTATAIDPFDQIELLINGVLVRPSETCVNLKVAKRWQVFGEEHFRSVSIDVAIHLSSSSLVDELDLDVRLITDQRYQRSAWFTSANSMQEYTTINMPDATLMHKPLNSIRLAKGDPDKIVFDLIESFSDSDTLHRMILRLKSEGLLREIHLAVDLTET